jgi:hypothetical protein
VGHYWALNWDLWVTTELWIENCGSLQSSELRLPTSLNSELCSDLQVSIQSSVVTHKSQFWDLWWHTSLNSELYSDSQAVTIELRIEICGSRQSSELRLVGHYWSQNWHLLGHYRALNWDLVGHYRGLKSDLLITTELRIQVSILSSVVTHKSQIRPL